MTRDSVGIPVPHGAPQGEIRPGWMQKGASELCWVRAAAMLVAAARAALLILLQQQVSSKAALGMLSQGMGGPFPTLHKSANRVSVSSLLLSLFPRILQNSGLSNLFGRKLP